MDADAEKFPQGDRVVGRRRTIAGGEEFRERVRHGGNTIAAVPHLRP